MHRGSVPGTVNGSEPLYLVGPALQVSARTTLAFYLLPSGGYVSGAGLDGPLLHLKCHRLLLQCSPRLQYAPCIRRLLCICTGGHHTLAHPWWPIVTPLPFQLVDARPVESHFSNA